MLEALAVKTEVIYLLQCDVLQAWEGGVRGRWFGAELSNPSDSSPQHLMLSKLLYCKNCKLCIIHDSLVILDTCTPFILLITSIESSLECTSSVLSPAEHCDSSPVKLFLCYTRLFLRLLQSI